MERGTSDPPLRVREGLGERFPCSQHGLSYGDYVERLTCLLRLKTTRQRVQERWRRPPSIEPGPVSLYIRLQWDGHE